MRSLHLVHVAFGCTMYALGTFCFWMHMRSLHPHGTFCFWMHNVRCWYVLLLDAYALTPSILLLDALALTPSTIIGHTLLVCTLLIYLGFGVLAH
jgi:hypothetical protein